MKYIYLLIDPINKKVRYVGATSNPKNRYNQHIRDADKIKKTAKTKKQKWVSDLKKKKMLPLIKIVGATDDDIEARKIEEKTVIEYIDTIYNLHMPGKGSLSVKHYKKTGKLKA